MKCVQKNRPRCSLKTSLYQAWMVLCGLTLSLLIVGCEGELDGGGDLESLTPLEDSGVVDEGLAPDLAPPPPDHPPFAVEMLELVNGFRAMGGTCG
ncbi:MAG: hypothetical protein VYD19_07415, partial [Myxococcota bacterium]|nr:hypothetical protein [Myxococcota bacterium]